MADSTERTQLMAKIVELEKEQVEFILNANYLGWTRDLEAAYQERANHIALLRLQLTGMCNLKSRRQSLCQQKH